MTEFRLLSGCIRSNTCKQTYHYQSGYRALWFNALESKPNTSLFRYCLDHGKKTVELSGDKSQVVRLQRTVQQMLREF